MDQLKALIREVPDFPKPGINFYDITTLLKDPAGFKGVIDCSGAALSLQRPSTWCSASKRADSSSRPLSPTRSDTASSRFARRRNCRPSASASNMRSNTAPTCSKSTRDAISPGQNVLIIDDVLATGGTAAAVARLVETLHGKVAGLGFILELDFLNGREKLHGHDVYSLIQY